jgi:hypothetical protein
VSRTREALGQPRLGVADCPFERADAFEVRSAEVGTLEMRPTEVGAFEISSDKVGSTKAALCCTCA